MEGRHSGVNPDRVIDAARTLRRIVHRLSGMVTAHLLHPQPEIPPEFRKARAECASALHQSLQSWFDVLQDEHLSTSGLRELASWPAAARNALLAEIESYRRLVVLMTELNQQFAEIPSATR